MPERVRLADHGVTLATRPLGAQIREATLERISDDDLVELDFDGVLSVSYSFADELVGRLVTENPDRVKVLNASQDVEHVVARVINRRCGEASAAVLA